MISKLSIFNTSLTRSLLYSSLLILSSAFFIANVTFSQGTANSSCLKGVCFLNEVKANNQTLPLKGVSRFTYYLFKVYTGAVYYPNNTKFELGAQPLRLELHYLRSISKDYLLKPASDFLKANTTNYQSIAKRVQKINSLYLPVKNGDRYALEFIPGKGTSLYFNGKCLGLIEGDDFAKEYFAIWLSEKTQAKSFRDEVLKNLLPTSP